MAITLDGTAGITDTGNITGGNIITGGQVVATGNITAASFIGDGSSLTGVDATKIIDGTSEVEVIATGGNIRANVAGSTVTVTHAGGFDITGDSVITGNLEVQGTTTTIDSTTVTIADLAINVANNAATSSAANGGGIKVGPVGTEYASLTWDNTNSRWDMDVPLDVNGKMSATTIAIGGTDVTATATEINKLDGLTATTAELNYVDGVTSAIQTQLNAKQATITGAATTIDTENLTVSRALVSDVSGKVGVSAVTATELGYLDGVTSAIQTQLNAKQATITGAATTIDTENLTASRALVSDGSGKVGVSAVTSTELGYLDGVTSAIQTQLDGKLTAGATSGSGISGSASSGTFTVTSNATSANTANTIVFRDASGDFSAGVITATSTQARYADLAEMYEADGDIEAGTVVMFGGDKEVTTCDTEDCTRVAGVISTNPSYTMNAAQEGEHVAAVALTGRVPCKVVGPVAKGDMMVSAGNGHAKASTDPKMGTVIGKALQAHGDGEGVIEVVVGRY